MKKIILFLCVFSFFAFFPPVESPVFLKGITIHGIEVGGLTVVEGEEKLKPLVEEIENQKVILLAPDEEKIWVTSYKKIGIKCNWQEALNKGIAIGNQGNLLKRWGEKIKVKIFGFNILLRLNIDEDLAEQEIQQLTSSLAQEPEDAKLIVHQDNSIEIKPEILGKKADTKVMLADLRNKLKFQGPLSIRVKLAEIKPEVSRIDIENLRIEKLLGQYTTRFNPQQINRSHNIKLAAQALDDYLLPPQQEFSFNKIVGPRTKEAGYNDAPIILNNRFAQGVGGGVCQVSSTLYNVVLRANLPVTERHAHTLPVHYVPKGLDAAVVYDFKDFRFINNTPGHILLKTYVWQGGLTIKMFGPQREEFQIELQSIVEKTIPPETIIKNSKESIEDEFIIQQEGSPGFVVRVERIIRNKENQVIIHEILTRDYYYPVERIIVVSN